jgi:hypothetical protein
MSKELKDPWVKETPEPWKFDGHGINDAEGKRIAKVCSCEPYIYPEGRVERNKEFDRISNLFAGAPELLAALISVTDHLERIGDSRKDAPFIKQARAAIAKAEGRS